MSRAAWVVSQAAIQVEHSLVERTAERELLPMAVALGLAVCHWSPLASGILSGKYTRDGGAATSSGGTGCATSSSPA